MNEFIFRTIEKSLSDSGINNNKLAEEIIKEIKRILIDTPKTDESAYKVNFASKEDEELFKSFHEEILNCDFNFKPEIIQFLKDYKVLFEEREKEEAKVYDKIKDNKFIGLKEEDFDSFMIYMAFCNNAVINTASNSIPEDEKMIIENFKNIINKSFESFEETYENIWDKFIRNEDIEFNKLFELEEKTDKKKMMEEIDSKNFDFIFSKKFISYQATKGKVEEHKANAFAHKYEEFKASIKTETKEKPEETPTTDPTPEDEKAKGGTSTPASTDPKEGEVGKKPAGEAETKPKEPEKYKIVKKENAFQSKFKSAFDKIKNFFGKVKEWDWNKIRKTILKIVLIVGIAAIATITLRTFILSLINLSAAGLAPLELAHLRTTLSIQLLLGAGIISLPFFIRDRKMNANGIKNLESEMINDLKDLDNPDIYDRINTWIDNKENEIKNTMEKVKDSDIKAGYKEKLQYLQKIRERNEKGYYIAEKQKTEEPVLARA